MEAAYGAAALVVLVAALVVGYRAIGSRGDDAQNGDREAALNAPAAQVCSDFDDRRIDPAVWEAPSDPNRIFARDGVLHLRADPAEPAPVQPKTAIMFAVQRPGEQLREVSLVVVVEPPAPANPTLRAGYANLVLTLGSRSYAMSAVDGPDGPVLRRTIFRAGTDRTFEEGRHPTPEPPLRRGRQHRLRMVVAGDTVEFYLDGQRLGEPEPTGGGAVDRWLVSVLADPALGEGVDVTIDDVCATYETS